MSEWLNLRSADGHSFAAWGGTAPGSGKALIVIQEIFGVNDHIKSVTDQFIEDGYSAIAPALFDRAQRNVSLAYDDDGVSQGRAFRTQVGEDGPILDILAALIHLRSQGAKKIGVIGYCWGGTLAFAAACRLPIDAAVDYYGTGTVDFLKEKPRCPVQMHFGEQDASIPAETIDRIRMTLPQADIHLYPADHGFNCDARAQYHADAALKARARTLQFLNQNLA